MAEPPAASNNPPKVAGASPFLVPKQSKLQLDVPLPPPTHSQEKPRFVPKLKPRPGAKSRASASSSSKADHGALKDDCKDDEPLLSPPAKRVLLSRDDSQLFVVPEPVAPPKPQLGQDVIFDAAQAIKEDFESKLRVKSEEGDPFVVSQDGAVKFEILEPKSEVGLQSNGELEDTTMREAGEDRVVREIDVHLSTLADTETKLYLLQYPLRPSWRPYGLEERCQEVRLKPKFTKLEVDLNIDADNENYDHEAAEHLRITKQTLTSLRANLSTNYAIGILRGKKDVRVVQLHLSPIHAVVQLRPSMGYLDNFDATKKKLAASSSNTKDENMVEADGASGDEASETKPEVIAFKVEIKKQETERQQQFRMQSHAYLKQLEEAEPWIALEPHGGDSPVSLDIKQKIVSTGNNQIPFNMQPIDYLNTLVPGRSSTVDPGFKLLGGLNKEPLSRSYLDTLPLEKRFHTVLSQGRVHVLQFERLMKLAPQNCIEQEVLDVLQKKALLVQGCWVAGSFLRYKGTTCIIRDYLLLLFTKNRVVRREQLDELRVPKEILRELLLSIAVQRAAAGGWEFIEATDRSFVKRHQIVAKEQAQRWVQAEPSIRKAALDLQIGKMGDGKIGPSHLDSQVQANSGMTTGKMSVSAPLAAKGHDSVLSRALEGGEYSGRTTMSEQTRAALPGALHEIFIKHSVCSLQFISQCLREMAITKSQAASSNPKDVAAAVAAAQGASAPLPELTAAVNQVATSIDGVYFLSSLGNPTLDAFREVVIALLRAKGGAAGLRRTDIIEASRIALKKEVPPSVYQKVMKELCYTKGATWVLKPGDGRPS
ncbi:hypothetical protein O6H91_15G059500 [Diphasiastrum complanatum]|uniref:Uncharacterized protein n=1 Tax=Diphasiastrum complanatum TaxID=34168 RepID=A0ACC2BIP8_DIPCM|nr:hypothetical protein O6H91_15G059500 [Diphasiastrum complanatum]